MWKFENTDASENIYAHFVTVQVIYVAVQTMQNVSFCDNNEKHWKINNCGKQN